MNRNTTLIANSGSHRAAPRSRHLGGLLLLVAATAWAAPGALDTGFDTDGIVITSVVSAQDHASAVALQPDGKLLVAGAGYNGSNYDAVLLRYNTDGSLDESFDGDGIVVTPVGSGTEGGLGVVVQPDGKVVVAGYSSNGSNDDFLLVRYNADGTLDADFGGGDGIVLTPVGTWYDIGYALALAPDGKLLVAGTSVAGGNYDFALVRYNADGTLDITFDGDGKAVTPIWLSNEEGRAVAAQPDGKIVVAGWGYNTDSGNNDVAVVRYNANGSLDTTFSGDGKLTTAIGSGHDYGYAVAIQPDGKLLVAGSSHNGSNYDAVLLRYNADGSLDTTFDTDGMVVTDFSGGGDFGYAVAVQPDGKVLVGGTADSQFALSRYNADGSLDTTFDDDGMVLADSGNIADLGKALAIAPEGKVVLAGGTTLVDGSDLSVARFIASDTAWGLAPDAFSFTDQSEVAMGSVRTSNTVTVVGLDMGVTVPLQISGGSYSLNGGAYTTDWGWVQNGDEIAVRHTASADPSTATNTTLTFGGLVAPNNPAVILGATASDVFTSTTEAADTTPDAFTFDDQTDVVPGVTVTSAPIAVSGINVAVAVSVSGGEYSVGCAGIYTAAEGTVTNGDSVCVRHTAAAAWSSAVNTTLTVGGLSDVFTSTTAGNAVPDPFSFTDLTDQAQNVAVVSNTVTVSGTTLDAVIEVSGGEYSIGCTDTFTAVVGTIAPGATVCVRHTTADDYGATVETTVTIGGVSDIFSSTTAALDALPDPFTFVDQVGVAPNTEVVSESVVITGINGPAPVSVSQGEYSIGCTGAWTAAAGTAMEGDSLCVRHTAAASHGMTITTNVTVGGVSDLFSSTTEAAPPDGGADGGSGGGSGGGSMGALLLSCLAVWAVRRRYPGNREVR